MSCYRPIRIRNGVLDEHRTGFDKHDLFVPCNRCPACRKRRTNDWVVRSYFEYTSQPYDVFFVTLDFDDEHLPRYNGYPCFDSEIMAAFLNRLKYYTGPFRYFYSCEYGGFLHRPHYHMSIFLPRHRSFDRAVIMEFVNHCWIYGSHEDAQAVNKSCQDTLSALRYMCDYVTKDITFDIDEHEKGMPRRFKSRVQASKGYGASALEDGHITYDDLERGFIELPLGKNGSLLKYSIPLYYELKFTYSTTWDKVHQKVVQVKTPQGIELSKTRHNRHYMDEVDKILATKSLDLTNVEKFPYLSYFVQDPNFSSLIARPWSEIVADFASNLYDFTEFLYHKPFTKAVKLDSKNPYLDHYRIHFDNLWPCMIADGDTAFRVVETSPYEYLLDAPDWSYYYRATLFYDWYNVYKNLTQNHLESYQLTEKAKARSLCKIRRNPALRRYLRRKNFNFSSLNPKAYVPLYETSSEAVLE